MGTYRPAFREMRRELRSVGRLVLTVPHAGLFAWLGPNDDCLRLPGLYRRIVGRGLRDSGDQAAGRQVEWHHHDTLEEPREPCDPGWKLVAVRRGGLFVFPLMDRRNLAHHPIRR